MRHITKGLKPSSLLAANQARPNLTTRDSAYSTYQTLLDKDEIRAALAREQGYLCAFCERRIQTGKPGRTFAEDESGPDHNIRIAHRTPVSVDSGLAITWENLLGSCKDERTCDVAQGNKALTVDPTKPASVATVRYERRDGKRGLFSTSDDPAIREDVEVTLCLNDAELPMLRDSVLKGTRLRLAKEKKYGNPALRTHLAACLRAPLPEHFGFLERMAR